MRPFRFLASAAACAAGAITAGCTAGTVAQRVRAGPDGVCLVKVFLERDATAAEATAIRRRAAAAARVQVTFVSRAQALAQLRQRYPDLYRELPSNPLPDAIEIRSTSNRECTAVARALAPRPAGAERVNGPTWVDE